MGPTQLDHIYAGVITALAILEVFGGSKGSPWVNPAAAAILVVWGLVHFVPVLICQTFLGGAPLFKGWVSLVLVGYGLFWAASMEKYWALFFFLLAHLFSWFFGESKDFIQYVSLIPTPLLFCKCDKPIEPKTSLYSQKAGTLWSVCSTFYTLGLFHP